MSVEMLVIQGREKTTKKAVSFKAILKTEIAPFFIFVDLHSLRFLLQSYGSPDSNDVESFLTLSQVMS